MTTGISSVALAAPDSLLWNHVGYERTGPKTAVVKNSGGSVSVSTFQVLDAGGTVVLQGSASAQTQVPGWGSTNWKVLDFSTLQTAGRYVIKAGGLVSDTFSIDDELLINRVGPAIVSFFNGMRSTDAGDAKIGYFNQPARGTHNVYGGWKDATGDDGKYLSHLSYANVMNPQQIPMVVWSLLRSAQLAPAATAAWSTQLRAEAAWGADYLLRVLDTQGYFYINVFRESWSGGNPKTICAWIGDSVSQGHSTVNYQAAWREGGGMSIAALALAAQSGISGDSSTARYLANAIRAFDTLSARKGRWDDDGRENLIDHYCALLAAVELYRATGTQRFADAAGDRADSIVSRQQPDGWFLSDNTARPFFHGVDEGLPLIALWAYLGIDSSSNRSIAVRSALTKSVGLYRAMTRGVSNPFVYPRMYASDGPVAGVATGGNLARGGTATATSTEGSYSASNAIDGSLTSRWGSALKDSLASVTIDLGILSSIDSVAVDWEAAYGKKYQIQLSRNGSQWTTACDGGATGAGWDGCRVGGDSARYVRMQGKQVADAYYGYSIYEIQVFGNVARPAVVSVPSSIRFFMPHRNETNYWWQGENARLGSMSAALLLAGRAILPSWTLGAADALSQEGVAGLDWVAGKNSAGQNFIYGVGGGNYASYGSGTNVVGGICNGITAESDAAPAPVFNNDGGVANWRWVEQWLPHDANFLLGAASVAHLVEFPPDVAVRPRSASLVANISVAGRSGAIDVRSDKAVDWVLLDPSGAVHGRAPGATSARFVAGRGTWIVQASSPDGIRQSRAVAIP